MNEVWIGLKQNCYTFFHGGFGIALLIAYFSYYIFQILCYVNNYIALKQVDGNKAAIVLHKGLIVSLGIFATIVMLAIILS